MKKQMICFFVGALLSACSSTPSETSQDVKKDSSKMQEKTVTKLEEGKIYPFMELKELYNKNWRGEKAGNADLDGKTVTITGEVFGAVKISTLKGNDVEVTGAKIELRGSKFKDPESGHDVECLFSAELASEISKIKKGTILKITGIIQGQQLYIESSTFKYLVMSIKDCKLVK
jgi:hypothetical protein